MVFSCPNTVPNGKLMVFKCPNTEALYGIFHKRNCYHKMHVHLFEVFTLFDWPIFILHDRWGQVSYTSMHIFEEKKILKIIYCSAVIPRTDRPRKPV